MPDYSKGKIYRIVCNTTGKQYVGSTINELYKRKGQHVCNHQAWKDGRYHYVSSFEVIEGGNYEIVLVEKFPCADKQELHARERYWIETIECVNMEVPTRTQKEYREAKKEKITEHNKEYYEEHKENIRKKQAKYYQDNKEYIKEKTRKYIEENTEKKKNMDKEYYEKNKDRLEKYYKEVVKCACGSEVSRRHIHRHTLTKKHQHWLESQSSSTSNSS